MALGLALGAGVALAGLLLFGDDDPAAVTAAATTTTTTAPAVWWVDAREIQLGPAVMVLEGLTVEDGEAVLAFEIFDLNPTSPGRLREPTYHTSIQFQRLSEEAAVAPERWTLLTVSGEIPGSTLSPRGRTARFELPGGVLPEVLGVRLDRYWIRLPYAYEMALPLNSPVYLDNDCSVGVSRLIEQGTSTIVQVDIALPGGFAHEADPGAPLLGVLGEGWAFTSGRTSTGIQLVHEAGPVPDPIPFAVRAAHWVPFDKPLEVDAGALRLG